MVTAEGSGIADIGTRDVRIEQIGSARVALQH
jgi:hypothetical protein